MKLIIAAAAAFACFAPAAAFAQTAAPASAAVAPAAKFNLDTPIEVLVADEKAKTVLATDLNMDITQYPGYDNFKAMSLRQIQPYSNGALTDDLLKKIEADLAAIK
jgi:hypothetical protein